MLCLLWFKVRFVGTFLSVEQQIRTREQKSKFPFFHYYVLWFTSVQSPGYRNF